MFVEGGRVENEKILNTPRARDLLAPSLSPESLGTSPRGAIFFIPFNIRVES